MLRVVSRFISFKRAFALVLLLGVLAPAAAGADTLIVPFAGVNFGGNSGQELSDAIDLERFDWGVSLAYMGEGILGIEGDIAFSPDFFGRTDIRSGNVLTVTGNLMIGIPIGGETGVGFRPYILTGLGVVRSEIDEFRGVSRGDSNAAWDVGGGAMFFFATHVGMRVDVRYFRTFGTVDVGPFDVIERARRLEFAKGSVGMILRF
jgi:opacity protein-like surface antigen